MPREAVGGLFNTVYKERGLRIRLELTKVLYQFRGEILDRKSHELDRPQPNQSLLTVARHG